MNSAIFTISFSFIPLVVTAGVPIRIPEGSHGFLVSFGIAFLFTVIFDCSSNEDASSPDIPTLVTISTRKR